MDMGRGKNVGAELYWKRYSELSGDTTKDLAVALKAGISTSTLSSWKSANRFPPANAASKIAEFFGTSVEYMVSGESRSLPYEDGRFSVLARKYEDILVFLESMDPSTYETIKIQIEAVAKASPKKGLMAAEETAEYRENEG